MVGEEGDEGEGWYRRHVRVTGLPEGTDGRAREAERLKSPERCKGSKDCESDGKHLRKMDFKKKQ